MYFHSLCQDACNQHMKEMKDIDISFKIVEEDEHLPVGFKKSSGHMIFTVEMDFTRKARWVEYGHRTPNPTTPNYDGFVSRDIIRILLTHAAVCRVFVKASDILNAYI